MFAPFLLKMLAVCMGAVVFGICTVVTLAQTTKRPTAFCTTEDGLQFSRTCVTARVVEEIPQDDRTRNSRHGSRSLEGRCELLSRNCPMMTPSRLERFTQLSKPTLEIMLAARNLIQCCEGPRRCERRIRCCRHPLAYQDFWKPVEYDPGRSQERKANPSGRHRRSPIPRTDLGNLKHLHSLRLLRRDAAQASIPRWQPRGRCQY